MAASETPLISGISSYIMFGICWIFPLISLDGGCGWWRRLGWKTTRRGPSKGGLALDRRLVALAPGTS